METLARIIFALLLGMVAVGLVLEVCNRIQRRRRRLADQREQVERALARLRAQTISRQINAYCEEHEICLLAAPDGIDEDGDRTIGVVVVTPAEDGSEKHARAIQIMLLQAIRAVARSQGEDPRKASLGGFGKIDTDQLEEFDL